MCLIKFKQLWKLYICLPWLWIIILKIIIIIIATKMINILTDKKIGSRIKQKMSEFLWTSDLNTEIIFSECINRNDNFTLEGSKYLFFLLAQCGFIESQFLTIPAEHASHKLAFESSFFKFKLLKEQ